MYISGLHGYNFDQASTAMPDFGIFLQGEWASTVAGSRGNICAWDLVDNTAVTGIMRETRGLRVILHPILAPTTYNPNRPAGVLTADIAAPAATPASSRSQLVVLLAYGPADYLKADTTATEGFIANSLVLPTGDTAGTFNGPVDNTAPTDNERLNSCGFSYQTVLQATGVTTFKGFVKCMGSI